MVFQDFDHISERRKAERERKFRKRVTIAAVTAFVLIILIAAAVFGVVSLNNNNDDGDSSKSSTGSGSGSGSGQVSKTPKQFSRSQTIIQAMCNGTTYKISCNQTLSTAAKKDPSIDQPKEFVKVSISAIIDEADKALKNAESYDLNNSPEIQAAFNVCKRVIADAKEELKLSVSRVGGNFVPGKLTANTSELNNWLSAVMSYQQTCVDVFPEGDLKSDMEKALNSTKQLTSNSLAMINQFSNYQSSMMKSAGLNRRLLESNPHSFHKDELPSWMIQEDRRVLEGDENLTIEPNMTVAKDGSGNFTTISEALEAMPKNNEGRYFIYVAPGIYEETVTITREMVNLTIYGEGSQKSVITGNKNVVDGVNIYDTASFVAMGEGLVAKSMGFRNHADPEKHQAVAARVQSDRAVFLNCRFEGYQNTLWAQAHRQFYRSCLITGSVDFIFGDASAVFQNCQIMVRKPLDGQESIIIAQARNDKFETTGIVLQNSRIEPDESLVPVKNNVKSYLGRPSKEYSRTIIMESKIEDFIHPEGWLAFRGDYGIKTLYYAEYNNKGPGANTDARVKWPGYKVIDKEEAMKYTVGPFLQGDWINKTGASVHLGLF